MRDQAGFDANHSLKALTLVNQGSPSRVRLLPPECVHLAAHAGKKECCEKYSR